MYNYIYPDITRWDTLIFNLLYCHLSINVLFLSKYPNTIFFHRRSCGIFYWFYNIIVESNTHLLLLNAFNFPLDTTHARLKIQFVKKTKYLRLTSLFHTVYIFTSWAMKYFMEKQTVADDNFSDPFSAKQSIIARTKLSKINCWTYCHLEDSSTISKLYHCTKFSYW